MRKPGYTAEAEVYRLALVRLYCAATNGDRRKTINKAEVEDVAGPALEEGNRLSRELDAKRHVIRVSS